MNCPLDKTTLIEQRYEDNIKIDHCPTCSGIWLDQSELELIQKSRENNYQVDLSEKSKLKDQLSGAYRMAAAEAPRNLACPKCNKNLFEKEYGYSSQVQIDICIHCKGIWLDQGELKSLEVFYERLQADEQHELLPHALVSRILSFFR